MDFISSFLDISKWVVFLNSLILPLQTMADIFFNLAPTILDMFNEFLLMVGDISEVFVEFIRKVFDVIKDLFYGTFFEIFKEFLDFILNFIRWQADFLSNLIDFFRELFGEASWVVPDFDSDGNAFPGGGDGFGGGGMGSR